MVVERNQGQLNPEDMKLSNQTSREVHHQFQSRRIKWNNLTRTRCIPTKVIWYFSPIPRFQRMFPTIEISKLLIWHPRGGENDGLLRSNKVWF